MVTIEAKFAADTEGLARKDEATRQRIIALRREALEAMPDREAPPAGAPGDPPQLSGASQ